MDDQAAHAAGLRTERDLKQQKHDLKQDKTKGGKARALAAVELKA